MHRSDDFVWVHDLLVGAASHSGGVMNKDSPTEALRGLLTNHPNSLLTATVVASFTLPPPRLFKLCLMLQLLQMT
jgi:hypothetical protein